LANTLQLVWQNKDRIDIKRRWICEHSPAHRQTTGCVSDVL